MKLSSLTKYSLRARFALGLGAVLLPFLVAAIVGQFYLLPRLIEPLEDIVRELAEEMEPVTHMQMLLLQAAMPVNDYLINGDTDELRQFEQLRQRVERAFQEASPERFTLAEERALIGSARVEWAQALSLGEQLLRLPDPVGNAAAVRDMKRFDAHIDRAVSALDEAHDHFHQVIDRNRTQADATRTRVLWVAFATFVLAAAVSLFASAALARPLLAGFGALGKATALLTGGDLSARAVLDRKDELGQLAFAFNAMAEKLEKDEVALRESGICVEQRTAALTASNAELQALNQELEETHIHLLQSEKMASIGQLAAGVAHEINNPIGYVYSNLGTLEKHVQDLLSMVEAYEQAEEAIADAEVRARLQANRIKLDVNYLKEDLRELMGESKDGITRVKNIVQNLKDFSHVDASDEWQQADLHAGLNSTLNIVNNEIKYKAEVIKEYGDIPEVECLPSQLNQVFMNLLVNASHAIEEHGTITIRTGKEGNEVWVEVADTGKGIVSEHLQKIFDPFFTTKPIGKGTGLGLSLSYGIIQKHHGRIEVKSVVGKGTSFKVWLPMQHTEDKW
ncbi:MAG: ATP-binding protein [Sulfuricella sp.]